MDQIYYYLPALETIRDFIELGGNVLFIIGFLTLFMWILIVERLVYLRSGHKRLAATALHLWESRDDHKSWNAHQIRSRLISQVASRVERNIPLIQTCVALCPLLGLLGTVTGMVEVFEVMAISGSGNPRSMASGVSKATIPTMAGMVAALSGVAMATYLQRKASRERELLADNLFIGNK
ncbi:MAG: MotA/TolQ/ExbB proton channel family protein [Gammaproteobacteria bacterium]|nr:MotA/TolQ/ExbB proton channel family protein [Gammaproteobacteria bacterium]MBT8075907.1 MotA/TolQ/ExbB proton channel family protein [Gammaproteobacteria bacterium]